MILVFTSRFTHFASLPSRVAAGQLRRFHVVIVNRSVAIEHGRGRVTPIAHIFLDILVTRIKKEHVNRIKFRLGNLGRRIDKKVPVIGNLSE
jgi:hypothetical protein